MTQHRKRLEQSKARQTERKI